MAQDPPNKQRLLLDNYAADPHYIELIEKRAARERAVARIRLLWKHRLVVLRFTGIGLVLFTLWALVIPQRFASTARLMPPDQPNAGMALLGALTGKEAPGAVSTLASEFLGLKNTGELFDAIMKSQTVEDDVIRKFNLREVYHTKKWEDARRHLEGKTDISVDRKSGVITIRVTDKNPERAAGMAQEYVEALNDVVTHVNTSSAHRERVFLEQRLAQVSKDLEAAEKSFGEFASKNTALDIREQGKAMISAGAALQGQLIALQTQLEGLKQIYTEDNIRVKTTEARITELRRSLAQMGGTPGGAAGAAPQAKTGSPDQLNPSIRELPLLGVTWADLYRNAVVQEKVFESLTQEYELAKVQEVKETPSVKVLDHPEVPAKGFPPRFWFAFAGTLLSLMAGIGFVLGNERWQAVDPDDPGKVLVVDVIEGVKSLTSGNGSATAAWNERSSTGSKARDESRNDNGS
jgi:uncharacterized protein involved in exopolysaccharide biosynthesis